MEIIVVGDSDTITGFGLAGIKRTFSESEAVSSLKDLSDDERTGIILITEKLAEKNKDLIEDIIKKRKGVRPIIVEIPDNSGPLERESDPIKELIRKAVGVEIE